VHQRPNDGVDLGYAEMRTPNEELTLGGGGSEWLWSGGDAECWPCSTPRLKARRRVDTRLASVGFHAEGLS